MKIKLNSFFLIVILLSIGCNNRSDENAISNVKEMPLDDYTSKIDSLIKRTSPRKFNGVILITKEGKTKYSKAFGYSDFESKTQLTGNENFLIKSNSKQVTAVLILKEVEKGRIDLEIPIKHYLPNLTQPWVDSVKVHHLLNFSSGITSVDRPLLFKPGTDFMYGVTTYTMLANILEKVTGQTYINLANELFKELNMSNSYCYEENKSNPNLVNGYINTNNTFEIRELPNQGQAWIDHIPAGGIVSNLRDLNIWDNKLHTGKILKPESYQRMITYDIMDDHEAFGKEKIGYGYGVRVSDKVQPTYIGHGGKGMGFVSIKIYFPESDVSLIVCENQYHEDNDLAYYHESSIREIVMNSSLVK